MKLKDLTNELKERREKNERYKIHSDYLWLVDAIILTAASNSDDKARIPISYHTDEGWVIDDVWSTGYYGDFDQFVAIIKKYLLINGFSEEDIKVDKSFNLAIYIKL